MEVYWGGSLIASHADSGYEWHHEEISGLTLDGITELAFIETGTPDSLGMFLDAVNVTCNGYAVVQEETAWADGTRFVEKGNWGMYFTYTVQGWELIDTIEVPSTTPEPTSTNVDLEAGHLYKIEAVGTYFFRHEGSPSGYLADAEWAYRNDAYGTGWTKGDDYPNSNGLDLCINDDSTNIDWGPLNEDTHTYSITYIPTATGPISFFIRDSYYGDNSGSLMVYIYEWK